MARRRRYPVLALCLCVTAGAAASAASAAPGRVLTQRDGDARNTITLSAQGAKAVHVFASDEPDAVEVTVRYRDRRAFIVDHARRAYASMPLADLLARFRAAREASGRTGGPADLRPRVLFPPSPRVTAVDRPLLIRGVSTRGIQVRGGEAPQRLWFAGGLPAVPGSIATQLSNIGQRSTPLDRALRSRLDSTLLRVEVLQDGRYVPVLETTSVVRREVPESAFAPPRGFRRITAAELFEDAGTARAAAPPANVVKVVPTNPVSSRRRVYNLYWGTTFGGDAGTAFRVFMNDATEESLRTSYSRGLRQYGIRGSAARKRSRHVNREPPRDSGANNIVAAQAMVNGQQVAGHVPRYWLCCGAKDPIIAVFVNKDRVESAAWNGYHFWVVTEAVLVPWPLSLAVHAGVPYEFNKVPDAAISGTGNARTTGRREATATMSHEYVEAATDPFPFFGWIDPNKTPLWTESEVADICASDTAVNGFTFAQYWSETDDRCFP